ncbi:ferredoxin [Streptomyces phyllanthi]|uniref:Ferredoxin n=1 Tax=Streptomyces phyllanthi TaxID=1803180 RepID=A0A5N8WER9_9ACTN|nr:ferredoxin [Streptomyces phyllanthi]MPY45729.1 ferredoxin [Streptomyces phyllanthi]
MVHIEVDEARCDGFGFCEQAAPEVFGLDDDGVVTVLLPEIPAELAARTEAATRACPVAALRIRS